jgi:hypothetical protein
VLKRAVSQFRWRLQIYNSPDISRKRPKVAEGVQERFEGLIRDGCSFGTFKTEPQWKRCDGSKLIRNPHQEISTS